MDSDIESLRNELAKAKAAILEEQRRREEEQRRREEAESRASKEQSLRQDALRQLESEKTRFNEQIGQVRILSPNFQRHFG